MALNEWLLDRLLPGSTHASQVYTFLDKPEHKGDRMAIRFTSPWTRKLWRYSKASYQHEQLLRQVVLMLRDEQKVHLVYEHEIVSLPDQVMCPDDDRYLIELAYSIPERTILTTDGRLRDALHGSPEITVLLADDFLLTYLGDPSR